MLRKYERSFIAQERAVQALTSLTQDPTGEKNRQEKKRSPVNKQSAETSKWKEKWRLQRRGFRNH
jgi:hypothetical protein